MGKKIVQSRWIGCLRQLLPNYSHRKNTSNFQLSPKDTSVASKAKGNNKKEMKKPGKGDLIAHIAFT